MNSATLGSLINDTFQRGLDTSFEQLESLGVVIFEKMLEYKSPEFIIDKWCICPEHQKSYKSVVLRWKGQPAPMPPPPSGAFVTPRNDQRKDWPYRAKLLPNQLHDFVMSLIGQPIGPTLHVEAADYSDKDLDDALKEDRLQFSDVQTSISMALIRQRRGQDRLRLGALTIYNSQCALCDVSDPALLRTSHIKGGPNAKTHADCSAMLCVCVYFTMLSLRTAFGRSMINLE